MTYAIDTDVLSVLDALGIEVVSVAGIQAASLCPFHQNSHDLVFSVNIETGQFYCHNPACVGSRGGSLKTLVAALSGNQSPLFVAKFLSGYKGNGRPIEKIIADLEKDYEETAPFPEDKLKRFAGNLWKNQDALEYMKSQRGMEDRTLKQFNIGATDDGEFITVPMYDVKGMPVGYVGRSLIGKRFKNSPKLPKKKLLWNISNARGVSKTVVLTEASFDAMRVWQATGYPVVATLGSITDRQVDQLAKYFSEVIMMTDNDLAGVKLGKRIEQVRPHLMVKWGTMEYQVRFPPEKKDCCMMTDEEIFQCVKNPVPSQDFYTWDLHKNL